MARVMVHVLTAEFSSSRREDKDDNSNDRNRSRPSELTLKCLVQIMITSGLNLGISNHRAAIHYTGLRCSKLTLTIY